MLGKETPMRTHVLTLIVLIGCAGPASALDLEVAAAFPTQAELEIDRIGKEMLAEGIPPREDHCVLANLAASELDEPRLIFNAAISLRENTCIDSVGVDSRNGMTFLGTKR